MPAATLRIMPARIISFWLMTSASAGTSRNVLMKYWLQRMGRGLYADVRCLYFPPMARQILKFDRTPVARLISCAASFASAALVFNYLSKGENEIEALADDRRSSSSSSARSPRRWCSTAITSTSATTA